MEIRLHASPDTPVELAFARPAPRLSGIVREYVGWTDRSPSRRGVRELPSGHVPFVILLHGKSDAYDLFAAGLHDSAKIVELDGPTTGMEATLTALGARLLFDRPQSELTNRTVSLDDVLGPEARRLQMQLHDTPTWEARFAILEHEIASRVAAARQPPEEISWAWRQLTRTAGTVRISALLEQTGWSERHFSREFHHQIGTTPKAFARVLRFARAVRHLTKTTEERLVDIANRCGYFDQAHFTREFRAFAGITPTTLLADRRPSGSEASAG